MTVKAFYFYFFILTTTACHGTVHRYGFRGRVYTNTQTSSTLMSVLHGEYRIFRAASCSYHLASIRAGSFGSRLDPMEHGHIGDGVGAFAFWNDFHNTTRTGSDRTGNR